MTDCIGCMRILEGPEAKNAEKEYPRCDLCQEIHDREERINFGPRGLDFFV